MTTAGEPPVASIVVISVVLVMNSEEFVVVVDPCDTMDRACARARKANDRRIDLKEGIFER